MDNCIKMENKVKYKYVVYVREGEPGFADDDDYKSYEYDDFMSCFISLCEFRPENHWPYLRYYKYSTIENSNGDVFMPKDPSKKDLTKFLEKSGETKENIKVIKEAIQKYFIKDDIRNSSTGVVFDALTLQT